MSSSSEAWVTLATNDSYALGALVLGTSLRRLGTRAQLVVLITPGISPSMKNTLSSIFDRVQEVDVLDSRDEANLALLTRPELGITFTKLHCWKLVEYGKCVFLDADTLVIHNCDELFERDELSAAPDSGWPDCFNSGVFVFTPSLETYAKLLAHATAVGSFDGGDQGLLNSFFSNWATDDIKKHLPFIYNMVASAVYSYLPAYKQYGDKVKIAHFIGPNKPWLQFLDSSTGIVHPGPGQEHLRDLLQLWWNIFKSEVHPKLVPDMSKDIDESISGPIATILDTQKGLAGAYAQMSLEGSKSCEEMEFESLMRKHAWEQGHIDYGGKDSFDNILKKIQENMAKTAPPPKERQPSPPKASTPPPKPAPESQQSVSQSESSTAPSNQLESSKVAESQSEAPKISQSQPESSKVAESQSELSKGPESQSEAYKIAESQSEAPKVAESQSEAPKVAESQSEAPKVAESQSEISKVEQSQSEISKAPESQSETSKFVQSQSEESKLAESQPAESKVAKSQSEASVVSKGAPSQLGASKIPVSQSGGGKISDSQSGGAKITESQSEAELEEKRLAERAAIEKKLSEQKKIAEQKLEAEKAAAKKETPSSGSSEPKVPPRKGSKAGHFFSTALALIGLSAAAYVASNLKN